MSSSTTSQFGLRLVSLLTLAGVLTAPLAPAWAAEAKPAVVPASTPVIVQPASPWRRYAFPGALVGAGLGLVAGVAFEVAMNNRTDEFNSHANKGCVANAPGAGAPGCADLLDQAHSAERWRNVGLGAAAAFAVTALVLKLTEPAPELTARGGAPAPAPLRLACAPGIGLNATCAVTF